MAEFASALGCGQLASVSKSVAAHSPSGVCVTLKGTPGVGSNMTIHCAVFTGWWLGHPSEKYESQLGWLATQYFWENKKCQPNHQPVYNWSLDLQDVLLVKHPPEAARRAISSSLALIHTRCSLRFLLAVEYPLGNWSMNITIWIG